MAPTYLDFEKPIGELMVKVEELRHLATTSDLDLASDIASLDEKVRGLTEEIFSRLTPWQKTLLSRHPDRPYTSDYLGTVFTGFTELHGDRKFSDDRAIMGGFAELDGMSVMVIGQEKGRGTREKLAHNFGMPGPEGYRKALRLMKLAEKFHLPVITLIDTPGAYPGRGAEERGQAQAIADSLKEMMRLQTPTIAVVIGEGGSGGALALGVANRVLMMQHAVYSVISPEGCASILWKDAAKAELAAEALRLTADEIFALHVIDGIIPEPVGGAHRDSQAAGMALREHLLVHLRELRSVTPEILVRERREKFLAMGVVLGEGG
ncbi:MAG: acetyl-CoA carboxylase carboxyltransferase subunit alpha [Magnetococcales bacterium]|nr:acetyl-CoA carboxylase carboxyltransferase subunit alpha [Magnetococcales bacterium]MBF0322630.1 acetyl-CoA carboxylase carboxyltransferase subunit alpha [Magnetococcales bacterium]